MRQQFQLLIFTFLFSLNLSAQSTYDLFSTPGLTISSFHFNFFDGSRNTSIRYSGEAMLCGQNHLVYEYLANTNVKLFVRIEEGKVWLQSDFDCSVNKLLYDFNLSLGDTFLIDELGGTISYEVAETSMITLLNGTQRRYIRLTNPSFSDVEWIEGIGDIHRGFTVETFDFEGGTTVVCAQENGVHIWGNEIDIIYAQCDSLSCATPLPNFDFSINEFTIELTNQSTDQSTVFWDFGDGQTSTEPNPMHTYSEPGCYNMQLIIESDCQEGSFSHSAAIPICVPEQWSIQNFEPSEQILLLDFVTEEIGWMIDNQRIWKTIDGGNNWTEQFYNIPQPPLVRGLRTLDMIDEQHGVIGCNVNATGPNTLAFLITTDGGETWYEGGVGTYFLLDATMSSDGQVFGSGQFDGLFYSDDFGQTFEERPFGNSTDANEFQYLGNQTVYATGYKTPLTPDTLVFLKSFDAGLTWEYISLDDEYRSAFKFYFINETKGFFGGTGFILRTEDGGQSFTEIPLPDAGLRILAIDFADELNGWAVGTDGIVMHTTDGGFTWSRENCANTDILRSISAPSPSIGFIGTTGNYFTIDPNGASQCSSNTTTSITDGPLDLHLFPNPTANEINIRLTNQLPFNENDRLKIYNALGQVIYQQNVYGFDVSINTTDFMAGTYFVELLRSDGASLVSRVIVQE